MDAQTKTYIRSGCIGIFVLISLISIVTTIKIYSNNQNPFKVIKGEEFKVENIPVPGLSSRETTNYTIELNSGEKISYIFVRLADQKENFIYKLFTPEKSIPIHDFFKNHVTADSSFNIISEAHADHKCHISKVECSGTYYDSQGNYHADGCWCRK
ncbi:MAG: hypothetical protein IT525_05550 [Nitrosomonas sp.]|nr:hypothetical protein [Nitrosomonas sp.]